MTDDNANPTPSADPGTNPPLPIPVTDATILAAKGQSVLFKGTGTLTLSDPPVLSLTKATAGTPGPVPGPSYRGKFKAGGFDLQLEDWVLTSPDPTKPPYNFMSKNPLPKKLEISAVKVIDNNGKPLLSKGTGTLFFLDMAILEITPGTPQAGGPQPGIPCRVKFQEKKSNMHLENLQLISIPGKPPYVYGGKNLFQGGIPVEGTTVFDNTADQYVIQKPTGTFFQGVGPGDNYFMLVNAPDCNEVNGGPVFYDNNSIHYYQNGYSLIFSEVLYQGKTRDGLYIFQQIG